MDRREAILKLGTLTEVGYVIAQANRFRNGFFPGRMTSWGYERKGSSLVAETRSWTRLWDAVAFARALATTAHRLGLLLCREMNKGYEPFIMALPEAGDFISAMRQGLGLAPEELLLDQTAQPAAELLFFGQDEVGYARDYLAQQKDNEEPSQAELVAAIGKNVEETAFSEREVAGYRKLNKLMATRLDQLHRLSFDWGEAPERYTISPVMFVGNTDGYAVGIWANRHWS